MLFTPEFLLLLGGVGIALFAKLVVKPMPRWHWMAATVIGMAGGIITLNAGWSLENAAMPVAAGIGFVGVQALEGRRRGRIGRVDGHSGNWGAVWGNRQQGKGFAAVAGMDELKRKLAEATREALQQKGRQTRNGILLHGEPGNGKTFIVEALAQEFDLPLVTMTYGEVNSMWTGETTENVMARIAVARGRAPCILFLDEADSLLQQRSGGGLPDKGAAALRDMEQTTNALLTELVNFRGSGVVVVAATNFIDKLDAAAIREGRFDFKIEITPPDEPARIGLLQSGLARNAKGVPVPEDVVLSTAKRWKGFSVKRILAVTEQVPSYVQRTGKKALAYDDMKAILREVQGAKAHPPEGTKNLDQLVLMAEQRDTLTALAKRLERSFEVEQAGGSLPTGLLFSGPPGTGKTETARALAKASGWAFLSTSGNDLIADPSRMDKIWKDAMNLRPAIVFVDEADDLLANREMSVTKSATNKFLTVMDGAKGKIPDLLWIAATNHPDDLDPAALRGGRFTEKIEFAAPDAGAMAPWITCWLADKGWRSEVDAPEIARWLDGQSIANVSAILQQAVNNALTRSDDFSVRQFSAVHLKAAVKTVLG